MIVKGQNWQGVNSIVKKRVQTLAEKVEEELDEVFQKHPDMEGVKLHLWAKIIQISHHENYTTPPSMPLITGKAQPSKPKA